MAIYENIIIRVYFCPPMKGKIYQRILKAFAIVQVIMILMITLNNALFLHKHILPNGDIIVHAHPYHKSSDNSPFQSHHHSAKELFIISGIAILYLISVLSISSISEFHKYCFPALRSKQVPSVLLLHKFGRAPPTI